MKKSTRRTLVLSSVLVLVLIAAVLYALPFLRIASSYSAKMVCSCTYIQNHPGSIAEIQKEKLNFSVLGYTSLENNEQEKSITSSFFGLAKRKAVFVEGRGCVLLSDENQPVPTALKLPQPTLSEVAGDLILRPDSITMVGVNQELLKKAVDKGMEQTEGEGALAIVVLKNGKLIAEAYHDYVTAATPLLGWSMTKSLTSTLVGLGVRDKFIDMNKKPVFDNWAETDGAADPRAAISVLDLLQMSSGLKWVEDYGSVSDATVMLYDSKSMPAYAMGNNLIAKPGEKWVYSSGTTNLLMNLVREGFDSDQAMLNYMYDSLFYPIGANSFVVETDQSGVQVGSSYGWATARDWAKLGQLWLQKGQWNGKQIIPETWVDKMLEPAKDSDGHYAGQIWLKSEEVPNLPKDGYFFSGFQGQEVFVLPTQDIVVVRLGHNNSVPENCDILIDGVLSAVN